MKKMRFTKHLAGFTLIEIVIGIGVFILILFALFNLYLTYGSLYTLQQARLTAISRARAAMSEITLLTLQARRVAGNVTIGTTTYYSNTTTMALQLPAITSGGGIISNTWDYVVFYSNGENLYRTTQADGSSYRVSETKLITNNLQSISFTYDNADLILAQKVTINIITQSQDARHTATSSLNTQLNLRNF